MSKLVNVQKSSLFIEINGETTEIKPNGIIDASEIDSNHPFITNMYLVAADVYKTDEDILKENDKLKKEIAKLKKENVAND